MDSQSQRKTSPSGHEIHGVHLCHRCGWPFPNPHPSAKHRRAHKKICGTVEGYKLIDSEEHKHLAGSDDKHLSDDDRGTPSPKIKKRSIDQFTSSGVTEISNKLEDEVFSDAVTEFSDTGFGATVEERLESARESEKKMEKIEEEDLHSFQSLEIDANADAGQMHSYEVHERAVNQLGSTTQSQQISSSCIIDSEVISVSDTRREELAVGLSNTNDSACVLSPIKSEISMDAPEEYTYSSAHKDEMGVSKTCLGQKADVNGNEDNNVDKILSNIVPCPSSETVSAAVEADSKLAVIGKKTPDLVTADKSVKSREEKNDGLVSITSKSNLYNEVESVEGMEAIVNIVQVESDPAQDVDVGNTGVMIEVCDTKDERNEDMHVISTATNVSLVDHPEAMIEDFKDHKTVKSNIPLCLGSDGALDSKEDCAINTVYEGSLSSFHAFNLGKSINTTSADTDALENNLKQVGWGKNCTVEEVPAEEEGHSLEVKSVNVGRRESSDLEAPRTTIKTNEEKIQIDHSFHVGKSIVTTAADTNALENSIKQGGGAKNCIIEKVPAEEEGHSLEVKSVNVGRRESSDLEAPQTTIKTDEEKIQIDHSFNEGKSIVTTAADTNALENSIKQGGGAKNCIIEEVPAEEEDHSLEVKSMNGGHLESSDLGDPLATIKTDEEKIQIDHSFERLEPHNFENHTTNVSGVENADDIEHRTVDHDTDRNANKKGDIEEQLAVENTSESKLDQISNLPGPDDTSNNEMTGNEFFDIAGSGSTREAVELKCAVTPKVVMDGVGDILSNSQETSKVDTPMNGCGSMMGINSESGNGQDEYCKQAVEELEHGNDDKVPVALAVVVCSATDSICAGDVKVLQNSSENINLSEPEPLDVDSESSTKNSDIVEGKHERNVNQSFSGASSNPLQGEGEDNFAKHHVGVTTVDISIDSSSQTDSLECNWGSVSVLSTQSDAAAAVEAEALPMTDSQAAGQLEKTNLQEPKAVPQEQFPEKPDACKPEPEAEPPSFMTLVESRDVVEPKVASSEIQIQHIQQPKPEALQAGWFPSLTNVVNESQGRKKNEEIIAKVTNWSTGKQHIPLKNLLGEADLENKPKSPNPKQSPTLTQKDDTAAKNNDASVTTVSSILGPEAPAEQLAKKDAAKEWNSPARYPTDNKKEKRKVKARPYWVPFVCCSSVN